MADTQRRCGFRLFEKPKLGLEEVSEAKSAQVIPSAVAIPVPIMKQEFVIARFRKEFHGEALRAFEGAMER
ncbi:hypothetical protein CS8_087450 [Cupriavidus sp. 8B]